MINLKDYSWVPGLPTGASRKVPHPGCSTSNALKITNDVEGIVVHCFKCGEHQFFPHEDQAYLDRQRRKAEYAAYLQTKAEAGYENPADFSQSIESAGLAWLGSGGWLPEMIEKYSIGWSARLSRVVIPVLPEGYTARAVHEGQQPKYLEKAPAGAYWISEPLGSRVCITEDILSAGNVSKVYPAMALLGTNEPNWKLFIPCKEIIVWTDNDKAGGNVRRLINLYFKWLPEVNVINITTPEDPKKYSTGQIMAYLIGGGADIRTT